MFSNSVCKCACVLLVQCTAYVWCCDGDDAELQAESNSQLGTTQPIHPSVRFDSIRLVEQTRTQTADSRHTQAARRRQCTAWRICKACRPVVGGTMGCSAWRLFGSALVDRDGWLCLSVCLSALRCVMDAASAQNPSPRPIIEGTSLTHSRYSHNLWTALHTHPHPHQAPHPAQRASLRLSVCPCRWAASARRLS